MGSHAFWCLFVFVLCLETARPVVQIGNVGPVASFTDPQSVQAQKEDMYTSGVCSLVAVTTAWPDSALQLFPL